CRLVIGPLRQWKRTSAVKQSSIVAKEKMCHREYKDELTGGSYLQGTGQTSETSTGERPGHNWWAFGANTLHSDACHHFQKLQCVPARRTQLREHLRGNLPHTE
ncbi:hypothetical protein P7K49_007494, partial [Saguinus oedipus]